MMQILQGFPDDVLAVRAESRITRKDYLDILIPAAEARFARYPKLRVYYETGPGFNRFDAGAMWEDFTYGMGHLKHWECVAIVTELEWLKKAVRFFSVFIPCPVRIFAPLESGQARAWVSAARGPTASVADVPLTDDMPP